ncbi:hypothetical protein PP182_20775 [Maribacter sp. PR1]|uniref:Uncharacterized protein n=1 Tax=Maribacter cobaltidurans TaxID=1178778 RepID=A0ABU7J0A1_9FLAO|nr:MULTISPECIES: hypothetical protein [Maribacter]MDC6391132.1 hypothetical protein [Maribacter sp. PR1]MEE1978524.1 hypothetical protein [Maribacter cobaltidurans]
MTLQKKQPLTILAPMALLLIPFVGMQFSNEVAWSLGDFVVAGLLLFTVGLGINIILRKVAPKFRVAFIIALLVLFLLVWAELAVGVFGTPFAGS